MASTSPDHTSADLPCAAPEPPRDPRAPMAAAPIKYDRDGQIAWGDMWDSFCTLATRGGPPHRSALLRANVHDAAQSVAYRRAQAEIIRAVKLVSGLDARPYANGWAAIQCDSDAMAGWLAAASLAENLEACAVDDLLLVPCAAHFRTTDEIKSVITVVAKTSHYWDAHLPISAPQPLRELTCASTSMSRRDFLRYGLLGFGSLMLAVYSENVRAAPTASAAPAEATATLADIPGFAAFSGRVTVRADSTYFYVTSDGMPTHAMMTGITSWQQQVPLPQPYSGSNVWRIPLKGVRAASPISAKTNLFRGAIALAVNGVPIFNALNNRGDDAYLAGELDQWGGHAGRADDYHYHTAPLHLQATTGQAVPIAYGLDGFPLYGLTEPDGSAVSGLDEFNGHLDAAGNYHYHASLTYPYINGGMRGEVTVRDGQVDPQPQAFAARPAGTPLAGATITAFSTPSANAYALEYQISGQTYKVQYQFIGNTYTFTFVDSAGASRTETYTRAEVNTSTATSTWLPLIVK